MARRSEQQPCCAKGDGAMGDDGDADAVAAPTASERAMGELGTGPTACIGATRLANVGGGGSGGGGGGSNASRGFERWPRRLHAGDSSPSPAVKNGSGAGSDAALGTTATGSAAAAALCAQQKERVRV